MQLNPYQKSLLQLLAFLAVFAGAVIAIGINRPHWRDEAHFVETVRDFGNEINIKSSDLDFLLFIDMAILTFLLMMPFFYLVWEKYFHPVMPLAAIYLLLKYRKKTSSTFVQDKPLVAP